MEIPSMPKTKMYSITLLASLCSFVYVITLAVEVARTSSGIQALLGWAFAMGMAIVTLRVLALLFGNTSRHLVASRPPSLVTKSTWFGKFSTGKRLEIEDAVWVRTRRVVIDTDVLSVEIGTHGYRTTIIKRYPYSKSNIHLATALCAEIVTFLKLEDKGYVNYA